MGSDKPDERPPPETIAAVKAILQEHTRMAAQDVPSSVPKTQIDVDLVEAWRISAKDPDGQIYPWLKHGAPPGILRQPLGSEIFPNCAAPSGNAPASILPDWQALCKYPGVEEHAVTEAELMTHIEVATWPLSIRMQNFKPSSAAKRC